MAGYRHEEFDAPPDVCDVIMKGGITSGVVYPLTLVELAKRFRFACVGGTSAGAIAAAAAAAAEYGRRTKGAGFVRLAALPDEAGRILFSLFQPSPKVAPLFNAMVAAMKAKGGFGKAAAVAGALLKGYRRATILGLLPGVITIAFSASLESIGGILFGLLLAVVGLAFAVGLAAGVTALRDLPDNDYGLCPGKRQEGFSGPGFTDWLADLIDEAAGHDTAGRPLTFGDLESTEAGRTAVTLRMMTTNLTMSRPYSLPIESRDYVFKDEEFAALFPERVMRHLRETCERETPTAGETGTYWKFPTPDALPVIVAARMSLSFPILICAVPLYRRDYTMKKEHSAELRRCLFSDGGLSSNFPIHFFDSVLPTRPTFGVSLNDYDVRRDRKLTTAQQEEEHAKDDADPSGESRVRLPDNARSGIALPIQPFEGLFGFLYRLINSAKDWQDNMQGTLPGYRERVVRVYLKPNEGGLNIVMPKPLVGRLGGFGGDAGRDLRERFDMDEHRWRRFLVVMDRFDELLTRFHAAYASAPPGEPYPEFLERHLAKGKVSYDDAVKGFAVLAGRADDLAVLAKKWNAQPDLPETAFPRPKPDLRMTPRP